MVKSNSRDTRDKSDSFKKAKTYAFLLLKFRLRAEKELAERLKKKKFDEAVIRKTVVFLKQNGFIDDRYFARFWIEERIKKPLGLNRLEEELKAKGIADEIIDAEISQVRKQYSERDIIVHIAREKLKNLAGVELEKAKKRLSVCLLSRGFSPETIIEAIEQTRVKL